VFCCMLTISLYLQVFKLKGADRKHKQDRDKVQKRTPAEQEKFARPYDKTILTDLPAESVYVPPSSRSDSPELVMINASTGDSVLKTSHSRHSSREETSPAMYYSGGGHQQQYSSVVKDGLPLTSVPLMNSSSGATVSTVMTPNMLSATASVETVTQWLSRNRYSSLLGNFRNYNGRDLLRLSREDVISMCGLSDGIRLYNDLHMAPVAPRTTFYVALKDSNKYDALFLEELTVAELLKRFAQCVGLSMDLFGGIFKRVSQGFLVRVTNEVVQYTDPESVFYFTLRHCEDGSTDKCDIILEDAIHVLHDVLKNHPTSLEVNSAT
jgi:transcription factor CP2-like protein